MRQYGPRIYSCSAGDGARVNRSKRESAALTKRTAPAESSAATARDASSIPAIQVIASASEWSYEVEGYRLHMAVPLERRQCMRSLVALVLPTLLLAVAAPRSVDADCTPLSTGASGCVPPDKPTLKCEVRVNKNVAKLHAAVVACHKKEADVLFRCQGKPSRGACKTRPGVCDNGTCNDGKTDCTTDAQCPPALFNDESCEFLTKFDAVNNGLTGCPACLDVPGAARAHTVGTGLVAFHDTVLEPKTSCAGTTGVTLGDKGLLPPDAATLRCEDAFGRNIARFLTAILACHGRAATAGVKGKAFRSE